MSSSNNKLLLSTVFTVGFFVGGAVVRFIGVNNNNNNNKELQQQILIDDDRENEIDDDDITVVNCKYYKKHLSRSSFSSSSHHSPTPSISSLYSSLSNFLTPPDSSIHELITKLNQLHSHQKNLYKRQQTLQSDTISFNYQYTYLLTEANVFKDYSCLQISKSKEKVDLLQQKIKSLQSQSSSENINCISEINNSMKIQIAEMKWLENFSEMYQERLENFTKNLEEIKGKFNEYKQGTLKEINELKERVEELKCEIGVYEGEETIKGIREEFKIGELSNLLFENGFIEI